MAIISFEMGVNLWIVQAPGFLIPVPVFNDWVDQCAEIWQARVRQRERDERRQMKCQAKRAAKATTAKASAAEAAEVKVEVKVETKVDEAMDDGERPLKRAKLGHKEGEIKDKPTKYSFDNAVDEVRECLAEWHHGKKDKVPVGFLDQSEYGGDGRVDEDKLFVLFYDRTAAAMEKNHRDSTNITCKNSAKFCWAQGLAYFQHDEELDPLKASAVRIVEALCAHEVLGPMADLLLAFQRVENSKRFGADDFGLDAKDTRTIIRSKVAHKRALPESQVRVLANGVPLADGQTLKDVECWGHQVLSYDVGGVFVADFQPYRADRDIEAYRYPGERVFNEWLMNAYY